MKKIIITLLICLSSSWAFGKNIGDKLKDSIVYLQISHYGYEQYQPWKTTDLSEGYAVGCAVGDNKVITIASQMTNVAFIQAKKADRNEYIPAKIKVIDYESNLALIELDANSLGKPLVPLKFVEKYKKGAGVSFYWLSSSGQMYIGRGFLDRVTVDNSAISYSNTLTFVAAGISDSTNLGHLYCLDNKPIGIASLSGKEKEADIIPASIINRFLDDVKDGLYQGIGMKGFEASQLLEPATRKYLKMPDSIQNGVYISSVYTIGTGSDVLKQGDVLLSIDGFDLNPYGRFNHPQFDKLLFDCLITNKTAGQKISFEVWRDSRKQKIDTIVKNFKVSDMLVPWYEFDSQPQYIIIGGCIFQRLTRSYLSARGEQWQGEVEPHIYNYLLNDAFKPQKDRKQIIVLSYCLPANINLGYHTLNQMVVDKINGMKINSMKDVPATLSLNPKAKFDLIEFEMDKPAIVLDKSQLDSADSLISQIYGVNKLYNISQY